MAYPQKRENEVREKVVNLAKLLLIKQILEHRQCLDLEKYL